MFQYKRLGIFTLIAAASLLFGCAATDTYRVNPRFHQQSEPIRTIAIMPAEVKVYRIDAGGTREEIDEWSAQAKNNILSAVQNQMATRMGTKMDFVTEELLDENTPLWEETHALYAVVSTMILIHTYRNPNSPSHLFEEKLKNFDYSLGSEVHPLAKGASALLFVDAEDHIWTGGRKALQGLGVILGIGAAVATGAVIIPQLGGGISVKAALVDSASGDILWINAVGAGTGDLRNAGNATDMVNNLFKDFPLGNGSQEKK